MKKRMFLMLAATAIVLAAIGSLKYRQIQAAMAQGAAYQPPPEAVTTIVAGRERWQGAWEAIGTATAVQGVMVGADLPGVVESIAFDSGRPVREGQVLVRLDTSQEQAQLASAQARSELALANLERLRGLRSKGVVSQAELDAASAEAKQAEASVAESRAAIARKTIRAPFSGLVGIRQVNLGQYMNSGDPVAPLQSLDPIHVDFSVPQQQVGRLRAGGEVEVTLEGGAGLRSAGTITAVDSIVDEATRNVQLRATLPNPGGALRPGMFVEVRARLDEGQSVVALPASAVQYAPYGDSVFIVEEMRRPDGSSYLGVRQQFVKLGSGRGDQVAVLEGIEEGQQVVTSGAFKLRNGAQVQIANDVLPGNDPAPRPEDK